MKYLVKEYSNKVIAAEYHMDIDTVSERKYSDREKKPADGKIILLQVRNVSILGLRKNTGKLSRINMRLTCTGTYSIFGKIYL